MPIKLIKVIKNKYFLSLSGNVVMSAMGMLTMAIIYRSLPINDVGIWVYFTTILLLADTVRSGFLTTAFIKFYAGSTPERAAEIAGSAWIIGLCITGLLCVMNIPFMFFLNDIKDPGYVLFFKWSGICFICMLPQFMATCVLQGEQRFDQLLYVRTVNQVSFVVFITALIIIHKISVIGVLWSYIISYLITSLFTIITGWSRINTIKNRSRTGIMDLFNFGKFSVGTTLSANLWGFSDAFIINTLLNKSALAIYNLGLSLMQVVSILLRSFAATAMPTLSAAYNQGSRHGVIHIMKKYVGMITMILIPITVFGLALADIPIYIIGGHKYDGTQAANVFRLFLIFSLLYPADRFFALTLDVIHRPKINFYKVLVMLAFNIAFDILGVKIFHNIYGIAVTTVVPILVGVIISFWALNKYEIFTFRSVYTVGYTEGMILLKETWQKFRTKNVKS